MNQTVLIAFALFLGIAVAQSVIQLKQDNIQTERIEYSTQHGFLVSSKEGTVYKVDDEGNVYPFVVHDSFKTSLGLHVDAKRNLLLIANSNGSLIEADLITGKVTREVKLTKVGSVGHNKYINDVTCDDDGKFYSIIW